MQTFRLVPYNFVPGRETGYQKIGGSIPFFNPYIQKLRVYYIGKPISRVFSGYNAITKAHSRTNTRATFGAHYAFIKFDSNFYGRAQFLCLEIDNGWVIWFVRLHDYIGFDGPCQSGKVKSSTAVLFPFWDCGWFLARWGRIVNSKCCLAKPNRCYRPLRSDLPIPMWIQNQG